MTTERNQARGPEDEANDQGIGDAGFAGMGDAAVNGGGFAGDEAHTADGSQAGGNQESWDEEQERLRLTNEANSQYDYLTTRQWGPDNLFDILDLDPEEATEADVVAAHKRLLGLLHPDKGYVTDHAAAQVLNVLYDP
ncbi:MAG: hypothetical protein QG623_280, partial [Patescibacteria group bacterium]|nr:hypothetical protein [Patescibacteria group bacterium]